MHPNDPGILGLVLQVGRTATANLDVASMLAGICTALPAALGVSGAAVVLSDPPDPALAGVSASDTAAARLGEMQLRAGTGPIQGAVRSGRPSLTPDLTRIGPPELAAAAADTGLTSSVVVPILVDGDAVGGLQVFGHRGRPVGEGHADAIAGLAQAIAARLTDAFALRRLTGTVARLTAAQENALPIAHATGMLAERYHTDVEEAERFLRSRAKATGQELGDMAVAVVERTEPPIDAAEGRDVPTTVVAVVQPEAVPGERSEAASRERPEAGRSRHAIRPAGDPGTARPGGAGPAEPGTLHLVRDRAIPVQRGGEPGGRRRLREDRRVQPGPGRVPDERPAPSAAGQGRAAAPHPVPGPIAPAAGPPRFPADRPSDPRDAGRPARGPRAAGGPAHGRGVEPGPRVEPSRHGRLEPPGRSPAEPFRTDARGGLRAGTASAPGPAGNATTVGPGGNATTVGPGGNATAAGPAGSGGGSGPAAEPVRGGRGPDLPPRRGGDHSRHAVRRTDDPGPEDEPRARHRRADLS